MEFTTKFKVLIIGIVIFLTTFLIAFFINKYVLQGKASGTDIAIVIAPETSTFEGTKEVNLVLQAPSGTKISAFNLGFKTTGSISVRDSRDPKVMSSTGEDTSVFTPLVKSKERIAYGSLKGDSDLPQEVVIPIVLGCDGVGGGTFTIDTTPPSQAVGTVSGAEFTFGTVRPGNYTCSKADGGGSTLPVGIGAHFSPATATIATGQSSTTNFIIDGFITGQKVSSFDVTLQSLPNAQLTVSQTSLSPDGSCQLAVNTWDPSAGTLRLVGICKNTTLLDSVLLPVTIKVPSTLTGASKIQISKLEVVGPQAPTGYTASKGEFSYSTTGGTGGPPAGGGNTHIILTLRLQGIQAKPKSVSSLAFRIGLTNKTMDAPVYQNGTFTTDDKRLFHGNVGFNVPSGGGYCILIKGPMHLQKKICDAGATETFPGTYKSDKGQITLNSGDNTFDFSKVYMMSCDLPAQDGICNAYDMSLIRNFLGHSEADALKAADINGDGVVNGTDWALAIASLSIKLDD
ncbi:hypothetical protein A3D80_04645 [Candidatus Roizmanbacteria bacterium RIFCSPHIGHO2_02_FULL_40_13b]|uniref:Dockerin domain-containing protein n=1 Tax=Candidatus Roizmanbacteria bacterium RIFCSPHIGHO2_01_FULL_39_24 TaxID=1802032 RepID=A0A1F7GEM9_9BACT|nr:MAG: hypothetical protein A2799_01715 [Candidatus Roizmanbacteria bacterium RIFCSPHIGHO2_01_FULL_39_24]OGK27892.1 MAG: hypothetical protein A3D80_04645 [Candidatus Roizmanbacteria bacterium RIFCSPHIGHO2_02_FULL_40_13b]OGK49816.1 MAG: hypothetical protein A3A56_02740 [Candidatus Roizmanbacteria bacterium RIFCSPLOWO2_01_FULL_40_32]OGK57262.1 MAG: hypothetical protein A3H83_02065 [Candidatus Roizmanbacteria bacterium RIFCSPLOWO2_02_FULL_39_8]